MTHPRRPVTPGGNIRYAECIIRRLLQKQGISDVARMTVELPRTLNTPYRGFTMQAIVRVDGITIGGIYGGEEGFDTWSYGEEMIKLAIEAMRS